jgi:DNA-directed RNA polymerase subunit RPC12/RpoP
MAMNYVCAWCRQEIPDRQCDTTKVSHGLCPQCASELKKEFHSSALMRAIADRNIKEIDELQKPEGPLSDSFKTDTPSGETPALSIDPPEGALQSIVKA